MPSLTTWAGGVNDNFPDLLRAVTGVPNQTTTEAAVGIFLKSDRAADSDVLAELSRRAGKTLDPKRYRDPRQLVRTVGLAYDKEVEGETIVSVTPLGRAVTRWAANGLDASNVRVIARYAARTLSAVQLRNPTPDGRRYSPEMVVFPLAFIWRAMLALDGRITREELNRGIYRTRNEEDLSKAIKQIRAARIVGNVEAIGEPAFERGEDGALTARRVRGWVSWASFGWTLISDERNTMEGFRIVAPWAKEVLRDAATVRRRHREFATVGEYVEHLSHCAGLPPDVRLQGG